MGSLGYASWGLAVTEAQINRRPRPLCNATPASDVPLLDSLACTKLCVMQ